VPDLGPKSFYAERGFDFLIFLAGIAYPIDFGVICTAMHETKVFGGKIGLNSFNGFICTIKDFNPLALEFIQFFAHLRTHILRIGIKHQNLEFYATGSHNMPTFYLDVMQQSIRIKVVEIIALGDLWQRMGEESCNAVVFAVVVKNIGDILPLLEHIGAACKIVCPGLCLFGPGLVAVKPLSENQQSKARLLVVNGLVGAFVHHEPVHATTHCQISDRFEVARIEGVCPVIQTIRGEGFQRNEVLSVDMGYSCGFPDCRTHSLCDLRHQHLPVPTLLPLECQPSS